MKIKKNIIRNYNSNVHLNKIIRITILSIVILYLLMPVPLFFLYPKFNEPTKLNFDSTWISNISHDISGDCYRKVQNFIRECPFPTREIHLNSEHTLCEIKIQGKWILYDPTYQMFFDNQNIVQVSFDVKRKYIPDYLKNYPFLDSLSDFHYYHKFYYILLNYTHPYYNRFLGLYYYI